MAINRFIRWMLAGIFTAVLVGSGPDANAQRTPIFLAAAKATAPMPTALKDTGEYGEDIYDQVTAKKWSGAARLYSKLKAASARLQTAVSGQAANKKKLNSAIASLGNAIKVKNMHNSMVAANQITLLVIDMSAVYKHPAPLAVSRLDYYGRELQIWSMARNTANLLQAARSLRQTWHKLRPDVVAHGGSATAKRFDGLMTRLAAARTPVQYGRLVTPILDEVDNLEKVYIK